MQRRSGYHRPPLIRFLFLTIPLATLLLGGAALGFDLLDGGEFGPRLDGKTVAGGWLLEATALAALFLLVQGRGGSWWLDGLLAAWLGWIFRGPVMVLVVVEQLGGGRDPWWTMALQSLLVYSLVGFLMALVARKLGVRR